MHNSRCDAIVLGTMDYRETDRIVSLFSLEHGKFRALARGAKKSRKRFGGALEMFARLTVEVTLRQGLSTLLGADIITIFPGIRSDLATIAHAGYATELVDRMLPEGMANPRLYRLLVTCLEHFNQPPATSSDRRFFEINLLNILGYRIPLESCISCGGELQGSGTLRHAPGSGGVLCGRCGRTGLPVSTETIALLRKSLQTGRFGSVPFSPPTEHEAGVILDDTIATHLNRPLNSLAFLRQINIPPPQPAN